MFENMQASEIIEMYRSKFGICFDGMNPILAENNSQYKEMAKSAMTFDADTYGWNLPSNGVPSWYTLVNINKIVDQLVIKRAYMQIGDPLQYGSFETNVGQYTTVGLEGDLEPYADFSATVTSDNNYNYPIRDVVRLQTVIQYGELEVATLSTAKIDAIGQKQYSASTNIAIGQNKLFFYGNLNSSNAFINQNFGILTDPSANSATPATNGTGSSPLWSDKAQRGASQDIANDVVVTAFEVLQSQMGGNIELTDKFRLCVSPTASAYLNAVNLYGLSAKTLIKETMPNIEFVFAPEYATIGSFQLIAVDAIMENMIKDFFTYKLKSHTLIPSMSGARQKWSFGSFGCLILNYAPLVTISGIQ